MTVIIVMILPKLRRVWSGEKVVLTTVLNDRYKVGSTPVAGDSPCNHEDKAAVADERIHLKEGDPLPFPIEQQVLRLHGVLRTVENRWYVHCCCVPSCVAMHPARVSPASRPVVAQL